MSHQVFDADFDKADHIGEIRRRDTLAAAHRVLARIEERRAPHVELQRPDLPQMRREANSLIGAKMRLFQIKIEPVHDYSWTLNHSNEEYRTRYEKEREEQVVKEAEQAATLIAHGITLHKNAPTVITEKQMTGLVVGQVKFELIGEIKTDEDDPTDLNGVMRKFNRMAAKLLSAPALQPTAHQHTAQNERVHVHMPGQALSTYNRVQLLENCCSDEVQRSLDEGWRIIAACPQPDARRPDYILGKFEPTRNVTEVNNNYADRG